MVAFWEAWCGGEALASLSPFSFDETPTPLSRGGVLVRYLPIATGRPRLSNKPGSTTHHGLADEVEPVSRPKSVHMLFLLDVGVVANVSGAWTNR